MDKELEIAIGELGAFYGLASADAYLKRIVSGDASSGMPDRDLKSRMLGLITESGQTILSLPQITEKIAESKVDLVKDLCITPFSPDDVQSADKNPMNKLDAGGFKEQGIGKPSADFYTVDEIRSKDNSGDAIQCKVHTIQVFSAERTPSVSDTDLCSIFSNAMPTMEMSRAIPYLDIKVKLPLAIDDKTTRDISIARFLLGKKTPDGIDKNITHATDFASVATKDKISSLKSADDRKEALKETAAFEVVGGMELFCSPQTMVPRPEALDPLGDPFRPFMSIDNFDINVQGAGGLMSFKTATMNIRLHDRTRLKDILPLIAPANPGGCRLEITYGWSHPDGQLLHRPADAQKNRYGKIIDSMRVTETYAVVQSNYKFEENGEVTLDINLSLLGSNSFDTTEVTNAEVDTLEESMQKTFESIGNIIQKLRRTQRAVGKVDIPKIVSASTNLGGASLLAKKDAAKIKKFLSASTKNPDLKEIKKELKKLYGSSGTGGTIKALQATKLSIITKMLDNLATTPDPYLRPGLGSFGKVSAGHANREEEFGPGSGKKKHTWVSFGKLFTSFVATALAANEEFEECQVVFYPFNESAGGAFTANIAQFPISISALKTIVTEKFNVTGRLTVAAFMRVLNVYFLRDHGQPIYGLSTLYGSRDKKNRAKRPRAKGVKTTDLFNSEKIKKLRKIYGLKDSSAGVSFTMPQVTLRFDAQPLQVAKGIKKGDCLRIHVLDQANSSAAQLKEVFMGFAGDGIMKVINRSEKPSEARVPNHSEIMNRQLKKLGPDGANVITNAADLDLPVDDKAVLDDIMVLTLGESMGSGADKAPRSAKDVILALFPSLLYGSATSNIVSADLSTQADGQLLSVNMIRQGNPDADEDSKDSGLPLQIMPTQLSLELLGCPYFAFSQQYFIDFGTNTTADNFYAVVGVQHKFAPGDFKTSLNLVQLDAFGSFRSAVDKTKKLEVLRALAEKEKG